MMLKSKGSSNPHNLVKNFAAFRVKRFRTVANQRGVSLEKVFNG